MILWGEILPRMGWANAEEALQLKLNMVDYVIFPACPVYQKSILI
jgi:hypothetical protein